MNRVSTVCLGQSIDAMYCIVNETPITEELCMSH
jgi:hypothetical protein